MNIKNIGTFFIAAALTILLFASCLYADTIRLKSGKIIQGKILDQIDDQFHVNTSNSIILVPFKMITDLSGISSTSLFQESFDNYQKENSLNAGSLPDPSKYDYYVERINEIPDLSQQSSNLPGNGTNYCGPIAISNSLIWLDKAGLINITPEKGASSLNQIGLAKTLGSEKYFNTNPRTGTKTRPMLRGLEKYLKDQGHTNYVVGYQGIQNYSRESPRLSYIKNGIKENKVAWLRLGFYKKTNNDYTRVGGHWVTLVGYGLDEGNNPVSNALIIHNSWGRNFSNDYIYLNTIKGGVLHRKYPKRIDAMGFYMANGFPVPSKADVAIIEGAIVLKIRE